MLISEASPTNSTSAVLSVKKRKCTGEQAGFGDGPSKAAKTAKVSTGEKLTSPPTKAADQSLNQLFNSPDVFSVQVILHT